MADGEGGKKSTEWAVFTQRFLQTCKEVDQLAETTDPETEPYKSKYVAAWLLEDLRREADVFATASAEPAEDGAARSSDVVEEAKDLVATLDYRLGLLAVETEEPSKGLPLLLAALSRLSSDEDRNAVALQEILNCLGFVASNRDDQRKAEEYLLQAEALYNRRGRRGSRDRQEAHDVSSGIEAKASKSESLYTMTTFYLAQVYGYLEQPAKSAAYSALTLNRQLTTGDSLDTLEWAQNATQLSGFYVDSGDFKSAIHCLSAAAAVLERDRQVGSQRGADVAANVHLGWGKLYMQQLKLSRNRAGERLVSGEEPGSSGAVHKPSQGDSNLDGSADSHLQEASGVNGQSGVPDSLAVQFEGLGLGPPELGKECDKEGLVDDYKGAVALFNKAMAAFKQALEYYVLDGFVSDHFSICMDISTLHKYLAAFEKDGLRAAAIHKRRAARLEPIQSGINPAAYAGIWKQVNFELGSIHREMLELKAEASQPLNKYQSVGLLAAKYFEEFLSSYRDPDNKLPDKVDDDEVYGFTQAMFFLARVYFKLQPATFASPADRNFTYAKKSLDYYQSFLDYLKRNDVKGYEEQADIAESMIGLLPQRLSAVVAGKVLKE